MAVDLFTPIVPIENWHPNFARVMAERGNAVRDVISAWAEDFVDRDGKFVVEFQRTFNSSFWELYLYAALRSLGIEPDMRFDAPDFVCPDAGLAIEAVIAGHALGAKPEWERTMADLTHLDVNARYIATLARLSTALDAKVRLYRERYSRLPHMEGLAYVIAIHNFATPDAHQLGDVAMQRLLYDVWEEGQFMKNDTVPLPTGLFLDNRFAEVSAVIFSSVATFGKARVLSDTQGEIVVQAVRIRGNIEPIRIVSKLGDYEESLRDGLRVFHNPNAARPLHEALFEPDDVREFRLAPDRELWTTCHPDGDLCMRQIWNLTWDGDLDAALQKPVI